MSIPYYHVDSFTDEIFGGNPAGVCILEAFPADAVLKKIAAENRHSETAFVVARSDGSFDLRWFTPVVEDDLCGHATLATAYILWLRQHHDWPVCFHTRSGLLTVDRVDDLFEMDFPSRPPVRGEEWPELLSALGLEKGEILRSVRDVLVVLDHTEQVQSLTPDFAALAELGLGIGGAIVTAPGDGDSSDVDYVCRLFAPSAGINEDPATGSIHCTLAPYWAERTGKQAFQARQLSARGGRMQCRIAGDRVKISGCARLYLEGAIHL
ncbi:PhzF family phenazine biosynthesis protein [Silvibacterium bohemicum]|uniref:PhzF family phenazine biosynthesis protein n=1 Tax=Silvibacterium bohemicum TaxID=1577686 RepID=A0A841JSA4_9BACT|nr:PhzF family phenazine biosynthesis protein [Silvibacterium bohemicum]MBB6144040.1 PhzF family phenazine biosynthesis protein [Silvibacterium bohemicum]